MIKIERKDSEYPKMLELIKEPPKQLYCEGKTELLLNKCVAIVGSRQASSYGMKNAKKLANMIGNAGITVVSGMAYGIDSAAHEGAINTVGGPIAVLGGGLDMNVSKKQKMFLEEIGKKGLAITEYPLGYHPSRYTFPRRNRIISGMSICTAVIEANFSSGSLITAELAAEQGRCVYALPGNIDNPLSLGTNKLIKDGAVPIVSLGDILMDMGIYKEENKNMGEDEKQIYNMLLEKGEMTLSQIYLHSKKGKNIVKNIIAVMEIKGLVSTSLGKIYIAK